MRNCFHVERTLRHTCYFWSLQLSRTCNVQLALVLTATFPYSSVPLGTARTSDSTASRSLLMRETKLRHHRHRQLGMPPASRACVTARDTRSILRGQARQNDTPTRIFTAQDTAVLIAPSPGPITPTIRRRSRPSTPDHTRRSPILHLRSR